MQLAQLWASVVQQAVAQLDGNQEHYSLLSKSEQTLKRFGPKPS
ncbi:hypothetical protein [Vibrio tetraodonis]|nr:hypothetical protein [Vibrio tetraodonis]